MQESGIDMTSHTSDVIHPEILNRAAYVITLCGHAAEHGPVISNPNGIKRHWGFDDPAKATGTEEEIMQQVSSRSRRHTSADRAIFNRRIIRAERGEEILPFFMRKFFSKFN